MRGLLRRLFPTDKQEAPNSFRKSSYSQCGEDLIVRYVFGLRGITHPTYIDIGANHPFFLSNTALFYETGSRGINIEANPELIDEFFKHRPADINLNIGISDREAELDFYIMQDATLSTFSKDEATAMISMGKDIKRTQKVKLTTLAKILETHFDNRFPDFMSLDVEGMDFDILQSINFQTSSPKIICVEAAEYSPIGAGARRNDLIDFVVSKGYFEYANTNLNAILLKNEFWFI
jgi:FkbM family methyltransferase